MKTKIVAIILLIISIALIAYGFIIGNNKEVKNTSSANETVEKEETTEEGTTEEETTTKEAANMTFERMSDSFDDSTFDEKKVIDSEAKGYTYELIDTKTSKITGVGVDTSKNIGIIKINWGKNGYDIGNEYNRLQTVEIDGFKGKVNSGYLGGFGQSIGGEVAFFIMKDKTLEYARYSKMLLAVKAEDGTVASDGVVDGITDVVAIRQANYHAPQSTGAVTTLAIKADGTFYDLLFHIKQQ